MDTQENEGREAIAMFFRLHSTKARRLLSSASVLALALFGSLGAAVAASPVYWTGTASNDWFDGTNWQSGSAPGATQEVDINVSGANAPVINGANAVVGVVVLGAAAVDPGELTISNGGTLTSVSAFAGNGATSMVTITGAGSSWANSSTLKLGGAGSGALMIQDGGTAIVGVTTLGNGNGSVGSVTVTDAGSSLTTADLFLGNDGVGRLTVSNGGTVGSTIAYLGYLSGGTGIASVDGAGSTWINSGDLTVGDAGTGTLNITKGGHVADVLGSIATNIGSRGTVTVDGSGSTWTNSGNLNIGGSGVATLAVSNGGAVSDSIGYIGLGAGAVGSVTVDGTGSIWSNTALAVGYSGAGVLSVTNGGSVTSGQSIIGLNAGSTGTATVSGAGASWANSADLRIGQLGTGTLNIANGGSVSNTDAALGFFASSSGSVTVDGAGSSWTSNILYVGYGGEGALTVSNGGVATDAGGVVGFQLGSRGAVTISGAGSLWSNSGSLVLGDLGTGALTIANGGAVSVGGFVKLASQAGSVGTLNIGGAAGTAAEAAGTLNAALVQFGAGTGSINFNHTSASYAFAPVITGVGTINQISGNTNLTADNSGFTGTTNITGGRLAVNGSLANALVSISDGGILGGNGIVGSTSVLSGGVIAPGNSIGTLTVNGNITQAAGSVYQVELTASGLSDRISATGTATIANGASLSIIKTDAAPYAVGTRYTVLQADGGVNGAYTLANNGGITAFLGLVGNYDATHAYLDVVKVKSFASVGATRNQIAAAGGTESLGSGNALYGAVLNIQTDAQARAAFDQLSGEIHASAKGVMIEDSRFIREAAIDRLRSAFDGAGMASSPVATYADGKPVLAPATTGRLAVWGRGFGSWGSMQGNGNAATFQRDLGGFFMGVDAPVADAWRIGAIGGYSRSSFKVGDRNASGSSDNYHAGLYGGTNWGNLALRSGLAYTWHDISTSRNVAFSGFADALKADYGAGTAQAFGELGYRIKAAHAVFEPFANLAYVNLDTSGFTERGGMAALTSQGSNNGVTFSTIGLRASTDIAVGSGVAMAARGMLGWRHAYGETTPVSVMNFSGGSAFSIAGGPIAGNAVVVDVGLDLNIAPNATLGLSYGGQFGSGLTDQTLHGNLNVRF
ncbi:autotransporter domain-containing protein [Rhodopseudomonas sp. P2A-2r]|uniref:autotransporter domain-containing protein n=1 Tax=unclassified Rhodopseudomonas TaxID=2638247 RepID=UPI0022344F28|nr:autotransporter domain-containing protein [Rhodopseudomonas sp. P2A-2r]UZE49092.1 autotransporter outer membrane beta-barrel domain-containing protein [Rhodopseudomonas sp. P2A-2r]